MTGLDFHLLSPLIALAAGAAGVMLLLVLRRSHTLAMAITMVGLAAAFGLLLHAAKGASPMAGPIPLRESGLLVVDNFALLFMGLLIAAGAIVAMLAHGYLSTLRGLREEFYILLLLVVLGACTLACANHFAIFFLGLELLSVPLYAMIAYRRESPEGAEGGLKYLVLAGMSSALLLFGMAMVYAALGTMNLDSLSLKVFSGADAMTLAGLGLMLVAVLFKLAIVPMHLWTPDVYQAAPAPVTALIATVSKGGVLALLVRWGLMLQVHELPTVTAALSALAIASMLGGNLLALLQGNVKRVLAYSSIAQMGYILVAFLAGKEYAAGAVAFYLVAYFITILGAFGVVAALSVGGVEPQTLSEYRGLAYRRPALAGLLAFCLLSLAGMPLTAGFMGKFVILRAGVGAQLWTLAIVLVVSSGIGLFYYLRIVIALFTRRSEEPAGPQSVEIVTEPPVLPWGQSFALTGLGTLLLYFGIYPGPLIRLIQMLTAM